jgi:putative redox protein
MAEVIVRSRGGLTQDVQIGSHALVADEPVEAGGADLGPNPYELLLAALGTCTAMTLRLYADRRQWPLDSVEVRLRHERVHAADCQDCDTQDRTVDRVTKEVALHGDLDSAQRQRLLEISERCPVQRTLQRGIVIEQRAVS